MGGGASSDGALLADQEVVEVEQAGEGDEAAAGRKRAASGLDGMAVDALTTPKVAAMVGRDGAVEKV